jgi:hypothetical protein
LLDLETNTMNGLAVARLCEGLKRDGFTPDIVVGHTGWGELLFVKDVWPGVPLLGYFEFFYLARDSDVDFDPEFPPNAEDGMRVRIRNASNLLNLHATTGDTPHQISAMGTRPLSPQNQRHPRGRHRPRAPGPHCKVWLRGG